ncbi:hypothetical protein SAMN05444581_11139 [Methylocapsa palsarum]|uniref:Uncharacterized protein n=1 Tax=Methylocapsa palsarum TaxID=1612308 RepID=A0A1I4APL4_9HYPH|nr:hypothetical protein SAMN05444581_11139 [Methylocapsa palsarum]
MTSPFTPETASAEFPARYDNLAQLGRRFCSVLYAGLMSRPCFNGDDHVG